MSSSIVPKKAVRVSRMGLGGIVETRCRVCTLPDSIIEVLNTRRRHFGDSTEELSKFFTEHLREWVADGVVPGDTTPISKNCFLRHYTHHAPDPYKTQDSKGAEMEVLRDALQRRAALYTQSHTLFSNVYEKAQAKVVEWGNLLEAEQRLREEYYTHAITTYMEARQRYQDSVSTALEAGETAPFPPVEASRMAPLPSLPGLEREEERILKLLGQLRQYTSEAAKIISYEEGLLNYIKIELEVFLQETAQSSLQGILDTQDGISLLVPPDKQDRLRTFLREYMEKQVTGMRTRFKEFIRAVSQFTRQTK